jgi:predicted NBD/HSP70 family sugar kinase
LAGSGLELLSGLAPFDRRGHQRRLIVDALWRVDAASRADLAGMIGLSPQMVTLLVEELIAEGLVREVGRRPSARGQPPIDLALDPEGGFAIGVQVEHGRLNAVLADLKGRICAEASDPCATGSPGEALPHLEALVERIIAHAQIDRQRLLGAGIVIPGPFGDVENVERDPLAMPAWSRSAFRESFANALAMPVFIGNDATAAAVGEHLDGAARDLRHFVYLYLGEGVGAGLFVEGHPATGAFGNAGEIGRMLVPDPDRAGTAAELEAVASLDALRRLIRKAGADASGDAEALFAANPDVAEVWRMRAAAALRVAVANIENLLDPDAIVLGGPLPSPELGLLLARIEPLPSSVSGRAGRRHPRLLLGRAGRIASALGGATLPLFHALTPQPRAARRRAGAVEFVS